MLLFLQAKIAVSYTHLRAHETVLDLVCRLLLEKKKTTSHIYTTGETNKTTTMHCVSTTLAHEQHHKYTDVSHDE
mgnify:CR=1 FL=1